MSKKSKKAQTEMLEATNQAAKENQMEVTNGDVQEMVPATIVEASEAEVFHSQPEGQETVQPAEQTAEKPKKEKVDRRPYIAWLTEQLEKPCDRKLVLKQIMEKWPTVSKGGCQTFLTDMLNPKYTYFKDRAVVKLADGKVVFADKAPVAEAAKQEPVDPSPVGAIPEGPTEGLQPEQPAE